jgi:hypothetical protein
MKASFRKSSLALLLAFLTIGATQTFAQIWLPPTSPSPDGGPTGGDPVPTNPGGGGPSFVAIHLT